MKRFKLVALGLTLSLAAFASAPRQVAADEGEDCCVSAQQEVENACARLGSSVRYFYCEPGWMGSLCGWSYDCYPPAQ
ncbi:MAG: hypothetical protein QOF89_137 [Acidobacteriota bacterium]|jgi:hypothetical protein|nr:hypothetical protein [Acidobacteriota bacterium]